MPAESHQAKRILRKLRVVAISMVPRGANQGAHQLFWKAADGSLGAGDSGVLSRAGAALRGLFGSVAKEEPATTAEVLADRQFWAAWYGILDAFNAGVCNVQFSDAADKAPLLVQCAQEFFDAVKAAFGGETLTETAKEFLKALDSRLTEFGAQAVEKDAWDFDDFEKAIALAMSEAGAPDRAAVGAGEAMNLKDFLKVFRSASPEEKAELRKELDAGEALTPEQKAEQEAAKAKADAEAAASKAEPTVKEMVECPGCQKKFESKEHVAKEDVKLPVAVQKQIDEAQAKARDAVEKLEKAEKAALRKELVAKAEKWDLPGMPTETVVERLEKLHASDAKLAAEVETMFGATSALVKQAARAVFKELGGAGAKAGSARAKLNAEAEAIRKSTPTMSAAQAFTKAQELNPSLAELADKEERGVSAN